MAKPTEATATRQLPGRLPGRTVTVMTTFILPRDLVLSLWSYVAMDTGASQSVGKEAAPVSKRKLHFDGMQGKKRL